MMTVPFGAKVVALHPSAHARRTHLGKAGCLGDRVDASTDELGRSGHVRNLAFSVSAVQRRESKSRTRAQAGRGGDRDFSVGKNVRWSEQQATGHLQQEALKPGKEKRGDRSRL